MKIQQLVENDTYKVTTIADYLKKHIGSFDNGKVMLRGNLLPTITSMGDFSKIPEIEERIDVLSLSMFKNLTSLEGLPRELSRLTLNSCNLLSGDFSVFDNKLTVTDFNIVGGSMTEIKNVKADLDRGSMDISGCVHLTHIDLSDTDDLLYVDITACPKLNELILPPLYGLRIDNDTIKNVIDNKVKSTSIDTISIEFISSINVDVDLSNGIFPDAKPNTLVIYHNASSNTCNGFGGLLKFNPNIKVNVQGGSPIADELKRTALIFNDVSSSGMNARAKYMKFTQMMTDAGLEHKI